MARVDFVGLHPVSNYPFKIVCPFLRAAFSKFRARYQRYPWTQGTKPKVPLVPKVPLDPLSTALLGWQLNHQPCHHGRCENDAPNHSATLPTIIWPRCRTTRPRCRHSSEHNRKWKATRSGQTNSSEKQNSRGTTRTLAVLLFAYIILP